MSRAKLSLNDLWNDPKCNPKSKDSEYYKLVKRLSEASHISKNCIRKHVKELVGFLEKGGKD